MLETIQNFKPQSLKSVKYNVKGVGGAIIKGIQIGVMVLAFEDYGGMIHPFDIPGRHYVPTLETRLFSPQNFSHTRKEKYHFPFVTKCVMYDKYVILKWGQKKYWHMILLDTQTNIATFDLAHGFNKLSEFCVKSEVKKEDDKKNPVL